MSMITAKALIALWFIIVEATALCPVSVGELGSSIPNENIPQQDNPAEVVLTGLTLPCHARIFGWNIDASRKGNIEFAILRALTQSHYKVAYREQFTVNQGLNIFRSSSKESFLPNDNIAFFATEGLIPTMTGNYSISKSSNFPLDGYLKIENPVKSRGRHNILVILQESKDFSWNQSNVALSRFDAHIEFKNLTLPVSLIQEAYFNGNSLLGQTYELCSESCQKYNSSLAVAIRSAFTSFKETTLTLAFITDSFTLLNKNTLLIKYPVVWLIWSDWSPWGGCYSKSQYDVIPNHYYKSIGRTTRWRSCLKPNATNLFEPCVGLPKESRNCNLPCQGRASGGSFACSHGTIKPNRPNVTWIIKRPVGSKIGFYLSIERLSPYSSGCGGDRLEIWDQSGFYIGVFCGLSRELRFKSCSNVVEIRFVSDSVDNFERFMLNYQTLVGSEIHTSPSYCLPCGGNLTSRQGTIQSRSSPLNTYLPNENCQWRIKGKNGDRIFISFSKFNLTSIWHDSLSIIDGISKNLIQSYDGEKLPGPLTLYFHDILIQFRTDGTKQSSGFRLDYEVIPRSYYATESLTTEIIETAVVDATVSSIERSDFTEFSRYTMPSSTITAVTTVATTTVAPTVAATTIAATTTPTSNHLCKAWSWIEWSEWSACTSKMPGTYYGLRKRSRACLDIQLELSRTNCSLVSSRNQSESLSTDGISNATSGMPRCSETFKAFNLTVQNASSLAEFCAFSVNCSDGMEEEVESCKFARSCTFRIWSSWQPWSSCENGESQKRKRKCTKVKFVINNKLKCGLIRRWSRNKEDSFCPNTAIYPSHDYFPEDGGALRICDSACVGISNKTCRVHSYAESNCKGTSSEYKICDLVTKCNVTKCGGGWANWGECSQDCGWATRTRFAYCKAAVECDDVMKESQPCPYIPCAVDGGWTTWTSWSNCSKPCFGGQQVRSRSCTNPPPSKGGLQCTGISKETIGCNFFRCPVNGGFSSWSLWSPCDQPCGGGKISRYRLCNSPSPAFGGLPCEGMATDVLGCNQHRCKPVKFDVVVKFTNETFLMPMLNHHSREFVDFSIKVQSNLLELYKEREEVIQDIVIHGLSEGSINCNFSIIFNQSATDELVVFQHAVEDTGILNTMPVRTISFSSSDVPSASVSITAVSKTSTSISVAWSGFEASDNITGYIIFYREFQEISWKRFPVGPRDTQHDLLMLKKYTLYTIRVVAFTKNGNGVASHYVDCFTKEGVPSGSPANLQCTPRSSTELYLKWDHIDGRSWHGRYLGYMIRHREFNSDAKWFNITNEKSDSHFAIANLKPFTRYEIEVGGVTGAGIGKFAWLQCRTDEDVPSSSPANVSVNLLSRDGKIIVVWSHLPEGKANGILKGYTVSYAVIRTGTTQLTEVITKSITAARYSNRVILTGFKPYTQVRVHVVAFTEVGEGPRSPDVFVETCQCPKNVYVSWYAQRPYIYGDSSKPMGILPSLITSAAYQICQYCNGKKQHNLAPVNVIFNRTKNGKLGIFENEKELKRNVDNNAHFFLPIYGRQNVEIFQKDFRFILVAENSGSVLLVKKKTSENFTKSIAKLALSIWPALLVVMLIGTIIGTLLWLADRKINPTELNIGSYVRGTLSGLWWGFVTMTTVGYGDITPRSFLGKLIGMSWMLIGPILNALIVGSLTTAITAVITSKSTTLYGMTVAAISDSFEYNLAIRRNAKFSQTDLYLNNSAVIAALENGVVQGALLDSLSAADMVTRLSQKHIKVSKLFKEPHGFGIVLSPEIIPLKTELQAYIDMKSKEITKMIQNYSKAIEGSGSSEDVVKENMLGAILSYGKSFKISAIGLSVAVFVISIVSLLVQCIYRCCKRKRVAAINMSGLARLEYLEKELSRTAEELMSKIERTFQELHQKHETEREKWFVMHNYEFGVLGITKFGTMDQQKIKRKITLNDIMNEDLRSNPRRKLTIHA